MSSTSCPIKNERNCMCGFTVGSTRGLLNSVKPLVPLGPRVCTEERGREGPDRSSLILETPSIERVGVQEDVVLSSCMHTRGVVTTMVSLASVAEKEASCADSAGSDAITAVVTCCSAYRVIDLSTNMWDFLIS
eukprot:XP_001704523.1 Hypothetical protein GL50803_95091 [Giardia lamblia ATCC 50803]